MARVAALGSGGRAALMGSAPFASGCDSRRSAHQALLRSGMQIVQAPVLSHRRIAADHFQLRAEAPGIARRALPGQFIHVRCGDEDFPLLRRPFSLLDTDPGAGTVDFVYKVVGLGTDRLTRVRVGSPIDLLGPLGTPFELSGPAEAYLVAGGVGIPPMVMLARWLQARGRRPSAFLGARTKEWVICRDDFRRLGVPIHAATDDGTLGYRGSVVTLLERHLNKGGGRADGKALYICGPTPMMKAAARLARRRGLPAQVSLEERMGCAMGCCMGCVVEVTTEPAGSHARFQRVCTEGPVFQADAIVWR